MKKNVFRLTCFIGLFLSLEIILQVAFSFTQKISQKTSSEPYWLQEHLQESQLPDQYEPYVGWRSQPFKGKHVNINDQGVRKTWSSDNSNEKSKTVFFFGGSTTWGSGARDSHTVPSEFAKILHESNMRTRVENHAQRGYSFFQEIIGLLILLKDGRRPDYVIFYDGANDVHTAYRTGIPGAHWRFKEFKMKFGLQPPLNLMKKGMEACVNYSRVYRFFKYISLKYLDKTRRESTSSLSEEEIHELTKKISKQYLKSIEFLDKISQIYDFEYHCFWQPVIYTESHLTKEEKGLQLNEDPAFEVLYKKVNNNLKEVKNTQHLNFTNISDVFYHRQEAFYTDFRHVVEKANIVVAQKMFEVIFDSSIQ